MCLMFHEKCVDLSVGKTRQKYTNDMICVFWGVGGWWMVRGGSKIVIIT